MGRQSADIEAYEAVRQRHVARFGDLLPEYGTRIEWPGERLATERAWALQALVSVALERSPWHRGRLAGIEPSELTEDDVERLPVMTKTDLMDNFDDIVTDRRLTRELCEAHLTAISDGYLLDEYRVVTSGGSSGLRGVYVYGWDAWAICYASIVRFQQRDWESDPDLVDVERVTAMVGASSETHMSAALSQTFSTPANPRHVFPVSQPLATIVEGLNDLQPTILMGYSSYLPRLALEARAGRLRIAPRRVIGVSEPLLPEVRASVEEAWGVPVASGYGMSEGLFTGFCGQSAHLPDDLCLVEPVAADGSPARLGRRSDRVLVTNLYNPVLPLIRFDVTDEVIVVPDLCPCGSAFRCIADPQGRLDDAFTYSGGVVVHPHVFRSAIAAHRQVVAYQVQQTARGADVRVVAEGELEAAVLTERLERGLAELGLQHPEVTVSLVAVLERQRTGKLKRFVTLLDKDDRSDTRRTL